MAIIAGVAVGWGLLMFGLLRPAPEEPLASPDPRRHERVTTVYPALPPDDSGDDPEAKEIGELDEAERELKVLGDGPRPRDADPRGKKGSRREPPRSAESESLVWPIESRLITSRFGARTDPLQGSRQQLHRGVDIRTPCGTPVVATAPGRVIFSENTRGSGNTIKISHGGGLLTRYAHLSHRDVSVGDRVAAGQQIGLSGASGLRSTGPHLHFEIWQDQVPRNPLRYPYRVLPSYRFARHPAYANCGTESLLATDKELPPERSATELLNRYLRGQ